MKYTYNDWWSGEVVLSLTPIEYEKDEMPKVVTWDDFSSEDIEKIKSKQEEIFKEKVSNLIDELKLNFLQQYKKSQIKEMLVNDEKNECKRLLFEQISIGKRFVSRQWNVTLENNYIVEIQWYVENKLKKGITEGFAFIHSPNCKYQPEKILPQIIAQSHWKYYNWLESTFFNKMSNDIFQSIEPKADDKKKEPNNPFQNVFLSEFSYQLFIELKELLVKPETQLSDYGFIFNKMKAKELINKDTKHKTFIDILNNNFDAEINADKFPFRNQKVHVHVFNEIYKKYKQNINIQ